MSAPQPDEGLVPRELRPLTDDDVKGIIQGELQDALGAQGTKIAQSRRKALQYYDGEPFGNEVSGRSAIVLTDVADTIEWIMPALMRMFMGGALTVRFKPVGKEDIAHAEQATEYINHVFRNEADGFAVFYSVFKTALLEKVGVTKVYYDERVEPKLHTYLGMDELTLAALLENDDLEIVSQEVREIDIGEDGEPQLEYDVKVRDTRVKGKIRIDSIPPEEFLISRRSTELDDETPFSAHQKKVTRGDLIAAGHDPNLVMSLPSDETPEYSEGRNQRFADDETLTGHRTNRLDAASEEVWVNECYIRIDQDGDGYSELRKITVVGAAGISILDNEEIAWNPFASMTPVPMPHKFTGKSVADQVMDLQLIRSTLIRNIMDNVYLTNNQRTAVVEGMVEIEDLLTSRPGGVVRQYAPGQVEPIVTGQITPAAFSLLEYLHGVKEDRTGVNRQNQGTDASALNQVGPGSDQLMAAAQARIELIARIFAETGIKRMFKNMLREMAHSPIRERVVRLRGEWVSFDPSLWNEDMDVEVEVGLGVGRQVERINNIQMLQTVQEKIKGSGGSHIVTDENVYNSAKLLAETIGLGVEDTFFSNPANQKPPTPAPDPRIMEVQRKGEEMKMEQEREMAEIAIRRENFVADKEISKARVALDAQKHKDQMELEEKKIELERQKLAVQRMAAEKADQASGGNNESRQ